MSKVLDYSFARPDPATIAKQGFTGVMRYLSPNAGKNLTPAERDALREAGLAIGLVWEWYAQRAKEGMAAGVEDGRAAANQANALGFPQYLPIYFAVDWDATPGDQGAINAYFQGIRSVLGGRKLGAYGGYWVIKRLFDAGMIVYGWQTYAWSGGNWEARAQLRQVLNGQWNGQVDFDESVAADYGAWTPDQKQQPPLPPVPSPAPGALEYVIKSGDTFWGLEEKNGWVHGTLQNLNPTINPATLKIGSSIRIPNTGMTGAGATPPAASAKHTIVAGDTFYGLEATNGWKHGTLQGLNPGINPTQLQIGQQINVPGGDKPAEPAHATTAKYKIAKGDTFWQLETNHGWGHGTLQGLNPGTDPTKLQIGAEINIPA